MSAKRAWRTTQQVATLLKVAEATVADYCASGKLEQAVKRVRPDGVEHWLIPVTGVRALRQALMNHTNARTAGA